MNVFDDHLHDQRIGAGAQALLQTQAAEFDGDGAGSLRAFLFEQAHCLLELTLAAEVEEFLARHAQLTRTDGKPGVVRNGYQPQRHFLTHLGPIALRIPKVRSRVDRSVTFRSMLVRPYLRRSHGSSGGAAWRFLLALSENNLSAAMLALMGPEAVALPVCVLTRLTQRWTRQQRACLTGSLAELNYRSLWIESLRSDGDLPSSVDEVMVAVGVDESARRRLLTVADGVRETAQSWVQRLVHLQERGLPHPPVLRMGPGLSPAVAEAVARVYPRFTLASY